MTGEEIWTKELFDVNGVWKPPNNWLRTKKDEIYRQYVEDKKLSKAARRSYKMLKDGSVAEAPYRCSWDCYRSQEVAERAANISNATWPEVGASSAPARAEPCPYGLDHWHI